MTEAEAIVHVEPRAMAAPETSAIERETGSMSSHSGTPLNSYSTTASSLTRKCFWTRGRQMHGSSAMG